MQRITSAGTFKGSQLMDELIAAIPTFRRVTGNVANDDMGEVHTSGDGTQVTVVFADDIPAASVQAVIDAHVPRPVVRINPADVIDGATTLDELKAAIKQVWGFR